SSIHTVSQHHSPWAFLSKLLTRSTSLAGPTSLNRANNELSQLGLLSTSTNMASEKLPVMSSETNLSHSPSPPRNPGWDGSGGWVSSKSCKSSLLDPKLRVPNLLLERDGLTALYCARPASTPSTLARNDQSCVRDARAREATCPPSPSRHVRDGPCYTLPRRLDSPTEPLLQYHHPVMTPHAMTHGNQPTRSPKEPEQPTQPEPKPFLCRRPVRLSIYALLALI